MPADEAQHGIDREPHRDLRPAGPDPAEARADANLRGEAAGRDAKEEGARHSVFNEPGAIFPAGSPAHRSGPIERDWSCDHCGYNVRGLDAGQACPECGRTSLYRPAPLDVTSYSSWLRDKIEARRTKGSAGIVSLIAIVSGVGAVFASLILEAFHLADDLIGITVVAPVMEEIAKTALLAVVIERRPYLLRSSGQVMTLAVLSAIVFASTENALALLVYERSPSNALIAYRLVACTALHVGCTVVAATGLTVAWKASIDELREARLGLYSRRLIFAIVIHGAFNAVMAGLEAMGYAF